MCEFCNENETKKIIDIEVIIKYENPKAYGYPEVAYWDEKYKLENCPICYRKLKTSNETSA
ncbi:hypothetical protein UMC2_34901 [[Clostridium] sordellii]|uniref:hypothetical protein n=1 Tax=Paraclostridium sordellii TaxID=1505 RepID=UPI000541F055|nr:hypothetical protein [Paeniclostridium sordellii]CEK34279.1 hypothetical protein UMC2_34901 [[Clostridium] sordellii] [Paeniclostridium sordellii]